METVLGAIGLVFVVLKLFGVIDWSWWVVTSPLWVDLVLIVAAQTLLTTAGTAAARGGDIFAWGRRRRKLAKLYAETDRLVGADNNIP